VTAAVEPLQVGSPAAILWVDDEPQNNVHEVYALQALGFRGGAGGIYLSSARGAPEW
jgi:hypothetical protein